MNQGRGIVDRNAANGDARDFKQLRPPFDQSGIGTRARCLGGRVEEGPEGNIVCPLLARLHRQMAAVMAGDADDARRTDRLSRQGIRRVFLADMHPVAAQIDRQLRVVIQNDCHTVAVRALHQRRGERQQFLARMLLQADLQRADRSCRQCRVERALEAVVNARRGQDVKFGHGANEAENRHAGKRRCSGNTLVLRGSPGTSPVSHLSMRVDSAVNPTPHPEVPASAGLEGRGAGRVMKRQHFPSPLGERGQG